MGIAVIMYYARWKLTIMAMIIKAILHKIQKSQLPKLKSNIRQQYNLDLSVYPQGVFFMKDFPVGFIFMYQMGVSMPSLRIYFDVALKDEVKIYLKKKQFIESSRNLNFL